MNPNSAENRIEAGLEVDCSMNAVSLEDYEEGVSAEIGGFVWVYIDVRGRSSLRSWHEIAQPIDR